MLEEHSCLILTRVPKRHIARKYNPLLHCTESLNIEIVVARWQMNITAEFQLPKPEMYRFIISTLKRL